MCCALIITSHISQNEFLCGVLLEILADSEDKRDFSMRMSEENIRDIIEEDSLNTYRIPRVLYN